MTEITERVEALEREIEKLSDVFDHIRKSLTTTKHPKGHYPTRPKTEAARPAWVEEIVQHFNEISVELKRLKQTLDDGSFADSGPTPSEVAETNVEGGTGVLDEALTR